MENKELNKISKEIIDLNFKEEELIFLKEMCEALIDLRSE